MSVEFIAKIAEETGMLLDPVYTGKAARGMLAELESDDGKDDGKFHGDSLFIHTGGIFGLFGQAEFTAPVNEDTDLRYRNTRLWKDAAQDPTLH